MSRATRGGHRPAPVRLTWPVALALALALLCAQCLGSLHSLQHSGGLPSGPHQALRMAAGDILGAPHVSPWSKLWSHAAGQVDCQLLDHLLHADLLPQAVQTLPPECPRPPQAPLTVAVWHQASLLQPYEARAPPSAGA